MTHDARTGSENKINNSSRNMFDQERDQEGRMTEEAVRRNGTYHDNLTASVVSDIIPETETLRE